MTINTLSENAKLSIKKDFKNIESDSEKQYRDNSALNQQFWDQSEHAFKTIFFEHQINKSQRHVRFSLSRNYREIVSINFRNEIRQIIKRCKCDNAFESNDIFNRVFKLLIEKLLSTLTSLFRVCVKQNYHSRCFKKINIIIFKKSNKNNYTNFKIYNFIILLNIINKGYWYSNTPLDTSTLIFGYSNAPLGRRCRGALSYALAVPAVS